MKDCIAITNPAYINAEGILERIPELTTKPIVAVFSLEWRFKTYKKKFSHLERYFSEIICCFEGEDDEKAEFLIKSLAERNLKLSAIIPWDDSAILFGSKVAKKASLDWLYPDVAERFKNKYVLKKHLREKSSVRLNQHSLVQTPEEALAFQHELNQWPIILKPMHAGGSWNVFPAFNKDDVERFTSKILGDYNEFDNLRNDYVLVEEYISGEEFCVNGQTDRNGNVLISEIFQYGKCLRNQKNIVHVQFTNLDPNEPEFERLANYTFDTLKSCELRNSPFHLEVIVDSQGPCLIEVACRLAGSGMIYVGNHINDNNQFEFVAKGYLGELEIPEPLVILPKNCTRVGGGVDGVALKGGSVSKIEGLHKVQTMPEFMRVITLPQVGDTIDQTIDLDSTQYGVLLKSESAHGLQNAIDKVREQLRIYCDGELDSLLRIGEKNNEEFSRQL